MRALIRDHLNARIVLDEHRAEHLTFALAAQRLTDEVRRRLADQLVVRSDVQGDVGVDLTIHGNDRRAGVHTCLTTGVRASAVTGLISRS